MALGLKALLVASLAAAAHAARDDPCGEHDNNRKGCMGSDKKGTFPEGMCLFTPDRADAGLVPESKEGSCSIIRIVDRTSKKGDKAVGGSSRRFLDAHSMHYDMASIECDEAFTRKDCKDVNQAFEVRGPKCQWTCSEDGSGVCEAHAAEGTTRPCKQPITAEEAAEAVAAAAMADFYLEHSGEAWENIAVCARADMVDGFFHPDPDSGGDPMVKSMCNANEGCLSERTQFPCMYSHNGCTGQFIGADNFSICTSNTRYSLLDFRNDNAQDNLTYQWKSDNPNDEPATAMYTFDTYHVEGDKAGMPVHVFLNYVEQGKLINDIPFFMEGLIEPNLTGSPLPSAQQRFTDDPTAIIGCYADEDILMRTYMEEVWGFTFVTGCPTEKPACGRSDPDVPFYQCSELS